MGDAVIAAALTLKHQIVNDNLMLRFPILVSTVVFLFLKLRNNLNEIGRAHV